MSEQSIRTARFCIEKIIPPEYQTPVDWAIDNIDFSLDASASKRKLDFDFSPFLIDPINAWDFYGTKREVTVVAPEQTGKTLCWLVGLLHSWRYKPCLSLVVYKSDEVAARINSNKLNPLLQKIPTFKAELDLPRSSRKDHYNFSNLKSYFMGSGSRIASDSSKVAVADELDDWQEHEGHASNLDDLRKRNRSFDESMLYKVCSPKNGGSLSKSQIWEEFKSGSQGYWTLKCQGCKEHTIKSCDTHHLQFESEKYIVKKGTCILVCPKCGHKHKEKSKHKMNLQGVYVHKVPEKLNEYPSFQWGCLASMNKDFSWDKIAQAQLEAGSSGSIKKQILFDNSYRGLPLKRRRHSGDQEKNLLAHQIDMIPNDIIVHRLLSVDTQDKCFYYVVRGFDNKHNSYLLDCGKLDTIEELDQTWEKEFNGGQCLMGIIDSGGHRPREIAEFVKDRDGLFAYKGRGQLAQLRWEPSKHSRKLILANPKFFKAELLEAMNNTDNKGHYYWYIAIEPSKMYIDQMLDHKPDNKKHGGSHYVNYVSTGNDHLFDCEKQMLLLNEMCLKAKSLHKK